jgi:hypothetical protein
MTNDAGELWCVDAVTGVVAEYLSEAPGLLAPSPLPAVAGAQAGMLIPTGGAIRPVESSPACQ